MKQLSNEDEGQEQLQVDKSAEDEGECKSEAKRDVGDDNKEWEPRLGVLRTTAGYAFMNV
jgi:hypothetical protein